MTDVTQRQLKIAIIKAVLDSLKNKKINWYLLRNMFILLRRHRDVVRPIITHENKIIKINIFK
jgi:hypothetical protein